MPKEPTIPKGAIFAPQPADTKGAPLTELQEKRLRDAYYNRSAVGRDSMYAYMKTKYPDDVPPKRAINRWLNKQVLQQTYAQAFTTKTAQPFRPVRPWHSISADLLDFTGKPSKQFKYVLDVCDNWSRYMYVLPITSKEAPKVAKAMAKILDSIKKDFNAKPSFCLVDQGGEFRSEFAELMRERGINIKRTLAASPWSNGLIERQGGRLKYWLFKYIRVHGGSWSDHLQRAVTVANDTVNRSTKMTPAAALTLDKAGRTKLRESVLRSQEDGNRAAKPVYPVNTTVQIKSNKSALGKSTTPSWSSKIYKVEQIYPGRGPMEQPRYRINRKGAQDLRYNYNDLKAVIGGPPEEIPGEESDAPDPEEEEDEAKRAEEKTKKKAAAVKKKAETDEEVVALYRNKVVKTDQDGGDEGRIVEMARRKVKGRKQWRIKVRWRSDKLEKWYSRRDIDEFMREQ